MQCPRKPIIEMHARHAKYTLPDLESHMSRVTASDSSASRRDFLKTSGLLAAGTAAASMALPRMAHAAGDDTLKIGLIGCGGRGTGAAAQALRADKNSKLIAMG